MLNILRLFNVLKKYDNDTNTELKIIRKFLQIVIVTAAVGLPVFFFTGWNWTVQAAITGLVFLLMVQVQFIISKTHVKTDRKARKKPVKTVAPKATKPVLEDPDRLKGQAIDPSVFSKFQKNLSQSTEPLPPKSNEQEEVVVSLSSQGKSKNLKKAPQDKPVKTKTVKQATTQATQAATGKKSAADTPGALPDNISVGSIGSIFDDISEPPEINTGKVDPVKLPARKLVKLGSLQDKTIDSAETAKPDVDAPLASNELLTESDFEADAGTVEDQLDISLSLARNYFGKKEFVKSLSTAQQFLDEGDIEGSNRDRLIELVQLKGDCELELEQFENASKTFQEFYKNHISNKHPQYLDRLEQTIARFVDADQQQYAVHFLFTALNEFRQQHEFHKMDEIYTEIESAYHQKQDLPRLIQTFQNHLAIKKTIKDFKGQLDILDHLGKLLYDQGDDEGSRKCYEQRLAVESQMEKS